MGNCWPKPVDDLPSTNTTKSISLGHSKNSKPVVNNATSTSSPPPLANLDGGGGGSGGDVGGGGAVQTVPPSGQIIGPNLKIFNLAELKSATRNFRPDTVLGEGGFGRVFKGWIDPKTYAPAKVGVGIPVAVKKSNPDSEQGLKEWQAEVKFLGKFSHPNLVKLLGYCWEEKQFLLVYEYMQKGSLESHLFRKGGGDPLSWDTRIKIATGAAKGLAFLHTTEKQVIYRDFKASNILLDGDFNAKLSDFGLAKLGPVDGNSHVTTKVVGTYGYAAPEYMATGHLYVKSDVYGFGVVLLEILTGLRVLDPNRPSWQINLVDWARPSLPNKKKLSLLMDPRLNHQYPSKGAFRVAELILKCLDPQLRLRPEMEEVLETLEQVSIMQMTQKDLKAQARQEQRNRDARRDRHCQSPLRTYHGRAGPSRNGDQDLAFNNLAKNRSY